MLIATTKVIIWKQTVDVHLAFLVITELGQFFHFENQQRSL